MVRIVLIVRLSISFALKQTIRAPADVSSDSVYFTGTMYTPYFCVNIPFMFEYISSLCAEDISANTFLSVIAPEYSSSVQTRISAFSFVIIIVIFSAFLERMLIVLENCAFFIFIKYSNGSENGETSLADDAYSVFRKSSI